MKGVQKMTNDQVIESIEQVIKEEIIERLKAESKEGTNNEIKAFKTKNEDDYVAIVKKVMDENKSALNSEIYRELAKKEQSPQAQAELLELAAKTDKIIITSFDGFWHRLKKNDPNKYYQCSVFLQSNNSRHKTTPLKFPQGTLSYIGAMTHRGKTTALISIALDAILQNQKVYFLTAEEIPEQILLRMVKAYYYKVITEEKITGELPSVIDIDDFFISQLKEHINEIDGNGTKSKQGIIKKNIIKSANAISNYMKNEKFAIIDHTWHKNFDALYDTLDKRVEEKSVVLIDYIQHLKSPDNSEYKNRQVIIQTMSQQLSDLAGHNNLIMIAAAQFNRTGNMKQKEEDKFKPDFLDLTLFRESGDIEQDAHLVIGIGQQLLEEEREEENVIRFYEVLKQRGHPQDSNKYTIFDNSRFSLYKAENMDGKVDGKLKHFTPSNNSQEYKKTSPKQNKKPLINYGE